MIEGRDLRHREVQDEEKPPLDESSTGDSLTPET
jgi:hypothetical protein